MKVVEINPKEFELLIQELNKCKKDKKELEKAIRYLNQQIEKYNKVFTKDN